MIISTIDQLKAKIEATNILIDDLKEKIEAKQLEINTFEYEISESDFDEFLDEIEEPVKVCGMELYPSDVLKNCDPIAYRCAKSDYESSYDLDDCEEYQDLKDELELLEYKLELLVAELDVLTS